MKTARKAARIRSFGLPICATSLLAILASFGHAEAAPKQLLNKTITASYTYSGTYRDPSGKISSNSSSQTFTEYVSSTGRIFERAAEQGHGSRDHEPGSSRTLRGEAFTTRFEGNTLVQVVAYASGAGRVVISFDPSFSSCTVDVMTGKGNGGTVKRKGRDGKLYEFLSRSVSGNSCTIRDGNTFGN
jgi:hypothetical protein